MSLEEINTLIDKWYETKTQISSLEAKLDKYKKYVSKIMDNNNTNSISNKKYKISRKKMSRDIISKKDIPTDLWSKYSKKTTYDSYYLTKEKE